MNERIEKLVTAAFPGTSLGVLMMYSPELEKFAELIVRECLEILNVKEYSYQNGDLAEKIKQHFGVEQ